MLCIWRPPILAMAGLLAVSGARAQGSPSADCAELTIRLAGIPEAANARCTGGGQGRHDIIDASGPQAVFIITHQSAMGSNEYLVRMEVGGILKQMMRSQEAQGWGEHFESEDFDVVRYRAPMAGPDPMAACFGFLRYSGHVAGSTGYRHALYGFYCDLAGAEPDDARIGQLLGAIDADFW